MAIHPEPDAISCCSTQYILEWSLGTSVCLCFSLFLYFSLLSLSLSLSPSLIHTYTHPGDTWEGAPVLSGRKQATFFLSSSPNNL